MEGGPYFFFLYSLYLWPWKERLNPDKDNMSIASVWIRLYSLPCEYWDFDILQAIGNALGKLMKVSKQTKQWRYIAFARICVYMDLSRELPETINLTWDNKDWIQPIDFENLSFRCRECHEYGNLNRYCHQNQIQ